MDILIIEEEILAYKNLAQVVQSMFPLANVSHSPAFSNEMAVMANAGPDLTIVDVDASKKKRLSNVKKLRSFFQDKAILVVSSDDEQVFAVPFIKAGANGFISKKALEDEFRNALHTIVAGRKYLSRPVWEKVVQDAIESKSQFEPHTNLSAMEKKVLWLMIEGNTVWEIAGALKVREVTIEKHRSNLRKKLNAKNLKDLIKRAALFL